MNGTLFSYLWIALGSALGGMARYACSSFIARAYGEVFPWGTLTVNIIGSAIIGFFAVFSGPDGRVIVSPDLRTFVMVGFCGGYTTFSSFSLQTLNLLREGDFPQALLNIGLSLGLCLVAVWLGAVGAGAYNQLRG